MGFNGVKANFVSLAMIDTELLSAYLSIQSLCARFNVHILCVLQFLSRCFTSANTEKQGGEEKNIIMQIKNAALISLKIIIIKKTFLFYFLISSRSQFQLFRKPTISRWSAAVKRWESSVGSLGVSGSKNIPAVDILAVDILAVVDNLVVAAGIQHRHSLNHHFQIG